MQICGSDCLIYNFEYIYFCNIKINQQSWAFEDDALPTMVETYFIFHILYFIFYILYFVFYILYFVFYI